MAKPPAARILRGTPRNLDLLARRLVEGELVAVPTETVYGLAANAFNAAACRRIFRAKRRPATDPLIIHLFSSRQLAEVCQPNAAAQRLAKAFWPGPLTLVLPKTNAVPEVVTAGRDSVAVRVPSHPLFRRLLKLAGVPLAAPSANPFGYVSPTTAEHVRHGLGGRIRYILDGGAAPIGLESTIVDLRNEKRPTLLRPGAVTRRNLERVLGCRVAVAKRSSRKSTGQGEIAPGMLTRHYSPRTPVVLHETLNATKAKANPDHAFVFLQRPAGLRGKNVFWFGVDGDLRVVARNLFSIVRRLDRAGFEELHVELAPGEGLAEAINDRLRRAAAR